MKRIVIFLFFVHYFVILPIGSTNADTLDDIKKKGVLVVGVKVDYEPFGYRDGEGKIIGLEPELASDVAKRLAVKLELVPVTSANRMDFLRQGKIDLMIATMSVTPEREKVVGVISPRYYAIQVALMADKTAGLQNETNLSGKTICSIKGAFFNETLKSNYTHKDLHISNNILDAEEALLRKECVAFAFDDALLAYKKKTEPERWRDYDVVILKEFDPVAFGIAVRKEDKDGAFGKMMSTIVTSWLNSGMLLDLEKRWIGKNSLWLMAMRDKY